MHNENEVFNFIVQTLATSVVKHRLRDKFQIWIGNGANGKGLKKTIMTKTFGQ